MRVYIIGCGSIGARHAANVSALGHCLSFFDEDFGKARSLFLQYPRNAEAASRVRETMLVIDPPGAVLICTPASTHAAVARELRDEGYSGPLFVEKPIALSSEECDIFRTWPHPTTMVGYMLRFHHMARAMRAMFMAPVSGRFYVHSDMSTWPGRSYADPVFEHSHEIDLAMWMGAPAVVSGASRASEDAFLMLGGEWSIGIGWNCLRPARRWEISNGRIGYTEHFDEQKRLGDEMYRDEIAHFLDCVEKGITTITPFSDGLRVLDVCEQAERMACVR